MGHDPEQPREMNMAPFEHHIEAELTLAELEAQTAEGLPERAVMSTFTVTGMSTAGTLNAAADLAAGDAAQPATSAAVEPAATPDPAVTGEAAPAESTAAEPVSAPTAEPVSAPTAE